jgi:PPOX class probable F420-dependent enzyme
VTQPSDADLWALIVEQQQGVLATISTAGSPQLSNVLYVADPATRIVRISTKADRAKARNVARNPQAALHVAGADFWRYAVANGETTVSAVAANPGDPTTDELFGVHTTFYGERDRASFDEEMIRDRRLVIRLQVSRLHGVIAAGGRRPTTEG